MSLLWNSVHEHFQKRDVAGAIALLEEFISTQNSQEFACLPGLSFSNDPVAVLDELNRFIETCQKSFDVKAIYLEMNGFDINYDRWFFDCFAYAHYPQNFAELDWFCDWQSPEWGYKLDWLCDWQSPSWPEIDLSGMAAAQEAFAWWDDPHIWKRQPDFKPIVEAAELLVMARFAEFIGSVVSAGRLAKAVPVLATAHEYNCLALYEP